MSAPPRPSRTADTSLDRWRSTKQSAWNSTKIYCLEAFERPDSWITPRLSSFLSRQEWRKLKWILFLCGCSKAFYLSHPCERGENLHVFEPKWNPSFCRPGRRSGPNLVVMEECQLVQMQRNSRQGGLKEKKIVSLLCIASWKYKQRFMAKYVNEKDSAIPCQLYDLTIYKRDVIFQWQLPILPPYSPSFIWK